MKIAARLGIALLASFAVLGNGPAPKVKGEFSAMARVDTKNGTRSMGFDVVVLDPMTMEEAQPLKDVLAHGGQQALINWIHGSSRGQIRLGGRVYPADIVIVEPNGDGLRYYVVTARPLSFEEAQEGRPSVDYPFSIFVLNVPSMGKGDGHIFTKAALWVDEDGHARAEQFEGQPGTLRDVKRLK